MSPLSPSASTGYFTLPSSSSQSSIVQTGIDIDSPPLQRTSHRVRFAERGKSRPAPVRRTINRPLKIKLVFAVDKLQLRAHDMGTETTPPALPAGPLSLRQRMGKVVSWFWPMATAVGSMCVFALGRVGIGLRAEDVARLWPWPPTR